MAENQEKTDEEILEDLGLELDKESTPEESNESDAKDEEPNELSELEALVNSDEDESINTEINDNELESIDNDTSEELEELITSNDEEFQEENNNNITSNEKIEETIENKEGQSTEDTFQVQKKQSKLRKILIGLIGFLVLVIITGAIMFFMGFFDPEEPIKPKLSPAQMKAQAKAAVEKMEEENRYKFKKNDIDVKRLNKKLNLLTKYEIIESDQKEKMKDSEREKFYKLSKAEQDESKQRQLAKIKQQEELRMKEMIQAAKAEAKAELLAEQLKEEEDKKAQELLEEDKKIKNEANNIILPTEEEPITEVQNETEKNASSKSVQKEGKEEVITEEKVITEKTKEIEPTQIMSEHNETMVKEEIKTEENTPEVIIKKELLSQMTFIKYISIETKTQDIFKADLDKIEAVDKNITLCRDNKNNIEVLIGPFNENENRDMIMADFLNNDINVAAVDFTKEEYNRRCNY